MVIGDSQVWQSVVAEIWDNPKDLDLSMQRPAHNFPGTPIIDIDRNFNLYGQSSVEFDDEGIKYLVNEFWTSGQRKCHSIHEISYRACFKPQLPEFFINYLTRPSDWVYDPFMGRGTTPVQASLMGRKAARNDVNPPSRSLARPRLRAVSLSQVLSQLRQIDWGAGRVVDKDLLVFYSQKTLAQITALRNWLDKIASIGDDVDPVIDWIRMVALNRFTGHSSGFFFCLYPSAKSGRFSSVAAED